MARLRPGMRNTKSAPRKRKKCEGCDGSGIRPYANLGREHKGPPPKGYIAVEKCDTCDKYPDDLAAAKAWGDDAHWQNDTSQAIAKPRLPKKLRRK